MLASPLFLESNLKDLKFVSYASITKTSIAIASPTKLLRWKMDMDSLSREFESILQIENFNEFIDVDENVQCYYEMTDEDICEQVEDAIQEPIIELDLAEQDHFPEAPSAYEALQMTQKLRMYFLQNGKSDSNTLSLDYLETQIELRSKNVQSKVADYFN